MGESSDREALRRLLRRVEHISYEPTPEERHVLSECENRVLQWVAAAGISTSAVAALALRRAPFPGPLSRLLATALPGAVAAQTALGLAGESCLCDLVAIAESSPLGAEAVRVLQETNPSSEVLAKHAPRAARWAPDSLPRLPEPNSAEDIRERLAAVPQKAAPERPAESDGWGTEPDVLSDLLGGGEARAPPQQQRGTPAAPPAKQGPKAW